MSDDEHPARRAGLLSPKYVAEGNRQAWLDLWADEGVLADPVGPSPFDPGGEGRPGKAAITVFHQPDGIACLIRDDTPFGRSELGMQALVDGWETIEEIERDLGLPSHAALQCSVGERYEVGFALGGLDVSTDAELLAESGDPIPGLHAAGARASNVAQDGQGDSSGICIGEATFFG